MTGTQILRIRTKFTAFPVSPARKLSGCDPHFRPPYGVAGCADLGGPRAAGGNSVVYSRKSKFCAPGYSVGKSRAESTERIRKSHRIREHSALTTYTVPIRILRQACTCSSLLALLLNRERDARRARPARARARERKSPLGESPARAFYVASSQPGDAPAMLAR